MTAAPDHDRHDDQAAVPGRRERPVVEASQAGLGSERAFRKKGQRFLLSGMREDTPGVRGAFRGVDAIDERRTNALQQKIGKWDIRHLPLDDESEPWRQYGGQKNTVDIARVVGNRHAGFVRQVGQAGDPRAGADEPENQSCCDLHDAPASFLPRNECQQHDRRNCDERKSKGGQYSIKCLHSHGGKGLPARYFVKSKFM